MALMDEISKGIVAGMRAKDQARLVPLRMAKAALTNREVEKGRVLDAAEEQQVMIAIIKQRRDSAEQFEKGGRAELAAKEIAEISTLEAFLPPPVDPGDLERAVDEAIQESGATSAKDLGRVMKAVMPKLAGKGADGRTINEIVRRKLGG